MKVYLATSGEYSDYRVEHVFTRREDAEAYALGDSVEERELREGPVEVRQWHIISWSPGLPDRERGSMALENPYVHWEQRDYNGRDRYVEHQWYSPPERKAEVLTVQGWDKQGVLKVYSEQRAMYLARQQDVS